MRAAEDGVVGDLLEAHVEPEVVGDEAPLLGEVVEVGRDAEQLVGREPGEGQVVLAQGPTGQVAEHEARLHAEQDGTEHLAEVAEQLGGGVGRVVVVVARRRQGHGEALQERPVGLQAVQGPVAPGHGQDAEHAAGDRRVEPRGCADLQVGHPHQLLEPDALERVDVGLRLAVGGQPGRRLAGDVPVHRALAAEQPGQVAEHRQPLERVPALGTDATHRAPAAGRRSAERRHTALVGSLARGSLTTPS